jgi:hypothetical protein
MRYVSEGSMMPDRYCMRCHEFALSLQTDCPFCGTETVSLDEIGDRYMHAIATAARQGGDAKQAPAESPHSGGAKTPHRPEQSA